MSMYNLLFGKNPTNVKGVGKPLITNALINALGPETTVYSSPFSINWLIKIFPGSDIPGMPASEISAISLPAFKCSTILPHSLFSLNL